MSVPFFISVLGPTAVGKTALVDELVPRLSFPAEIVNADMGQFYIPLSIGTAKPDLASPSVPHHLFDMLEEPGDYTVTAYRKKLIECCEEMAARGVTPLLVGGSSFYIASLFFPPHDRISSHEARSEYTNKDTDELYAQLKSIDPQRAQKIHRHDRYRITRALELWHATGLQPSQQKPVFDPIGRAAIIFLQRDKEELSDRISQRTHDMLSHGWIDEVRGLSDQWHEFLVAKKLIGYSEILQYLKGMELGSLDDNAYELLIERISQKTRGYAKRQSTFWKQLKKSLLMSDPAASQVLMIDEPNLTLLSHDLYLDQLTANLEKLYNHTKAL